jgi:hypothetical protein
MMQEALWIIVAKGAQAIAMAGTYSKIDMACALMGALLSYLLL